MFVVKDNEPKDVKRDVSVQQVPDGVLFIVNGVAIAKLQDNDDRLISIGGITKAKTGLDDTWGNHVRTVWDTDADTSRTRR